MKPNPDLLLTLVLIGPVLALAAVVAGTRNPFSSKKTGFSPAPRPQRVRWSDAELKRKFPGVYDRLRGGVNS